jgi:hypothetical protein
MIFTAEGQFWAPTIPVPVDQTMLEADFLRPSAILSRWLLPEIEWKKYSIRGRLVIVFILCGHESSSRRQTPVPGSVDAAGYQKPRRPKQLSFV